MLNIIAVSGTEEVVQSKVREKPNPIWFPPFYFFFLLALIPKSAKMEVS